MTAIFTVFILATCFSALSQWAGFGRVALALPLLISIAGVDNAVPMVVFAQLVAAVPRVLFNLNSMSGARVLNMRWWMIPFGILGALLFVLAPKEIATRGIGIAFVVFVLSRRVNVGVMRGRAITPYADNAFIGFLSGAVGSMGPFAPSDALKKKADASAFGAHASFAILIMHAAQMMVYQQFLEFDWQFWRLTLPVSAAIVCASRCVPRQARLNHYPAVRRIIETALIVIAAYMLVHGYAL